MGLRLYDTHRRAVREFIPRIPGMVSIYLCGPTVVTPPHVGQIRSQVNFDILNRWLKQSGYHVLLCRNVTDIEDKIIARSLSEGTPWWRLTNPVYRSFARAYTSLGCLPPSVEPRATGHIPEMIELVEQLVAAGHAYESDGNVYFAVDSYAGYGSLSRQRTRHMRITEEHDRGKRDPRDFALWKRAKAGEPVWHSPWGEGRPGWHLECSAMARKYLGQEFDIHGGGANLIFPHHENEMAQSRAAGDAFARFWLHNGPVTHKGEKIRKRLRNPLSVAALLDRVRPVELRYYLASAHYRSPMEFSVEAVEEAAAAFRRIERFVLRVGADVGRELPPQFTEAMDGDLNVPQALSAVHAEVGAGNAAQAAGDRESAHTRCRSVRAMLNVLGLDPMSETWARETHLQEVAGAVLRTVRDLASAAAERGDHERARHMERQIAGALGKRHQIQHPVLIR
ncbi:cysteine--tRNA ligase [Microbispora sp. RL4-1S]|uniref:Cysteine--tRNA ligase n=1 Tax=Microbispora oryzae TaxID=2806554 RepID=A0A940WED0_9ACTN|nr:cysteine--tRNA ligase [Microbispora oryzae]MBP2703088.1 cysteine--tRNA ligase [Microbispora oryzae]